MSLEFHTRYMYKKKNGRKFIMGDHHRIIIEALERVLRGECKRLIINVAPRYSKTELAVKQFISNGLALNAKAKFIHLSYGDDIALDNSESIKDVIQSDFYQELFPEVQIKKDAKAKDKWYTTEGGGVLARSAAGQVTGFGAGAVDLTDEERKEIERKEMEEFERDVEDFLAEVGVQVEEDELDKKFKFSGAIIIDDPIKPEDADQDTIREKVNSRFDSTIRNRVNSRDTPIIIIMQRLHPMDLSGYLMREDEQDEWEVISLPCIKEDGTALWPFKHTVEELNKMRKSNELVFERQYMQNPQPKTGLMFPKQDLKFFSIKDMIDKLQDRDFCYIAVDPANLGGDDFASITGKLIGDKIYVDDVIYNTDGADNNEIETVDFVLRHKANEVGVEGVFGWQDTVDRIEATLQRRGYMNDVRSLRPRTAKHVRIAARSSFIKNHFVFRDDYIDYPQYDKFMRNLTSYRKVQEAGNKNKHDEAPDVCEMVAGFYERNFPDVWPTIV